MREGAVVLDDRRVIDFRLYAVMVLRVILFAVNVCVLGLVDEVQVQAFHELHFQSEVDVVVLRLVRVVRVFHLVDRDVGLVLQAEVVQAVQLILALARVPLCGRAVQVVEHAVGDTAVEVAVTGEAVVVAAVRVAGDDEKIDFERWFKSPYHPTPTIIAAAVEAYATHDISKIAQSEAGQNNINACEKEINRIIAYAQCEKKKCICFVTGVPGAGKTLVGLDVVAKNLANGTDGLSVYLSGNGPLVEVLRAALKKSAKERNLVGRETESAINALIQNSFAFKRDNAMRTTPPTEKILIFDEAQRVWDEKKMKEKHNEPEMALSEPNLLYKIMDRHQDWAVMICLVGLGQDIYDGEVGINEWFKCGIEQFPEWELFYSNSIFDQSEDKLIDRKLIESCSHCHNVTALHLKTSVRSFRADKQCKFVDYLLDNNPIEAKNIYKDISCKYPIYVTRDLMLAKRWAKSQVRGSQRCGLLASSKALRLMAEGIYVPKDINVEKWFLAEPEDPRSSNRMEIAASEFKVQGLEVDWAIVGWDLDVRRNPDNSDWNYHTINATSGLWTKSEKKDRDKRYMLNAYRVLLTRARQGMVIYVPKGVDIEDDETRPSFLYDMIYDYLHNSCGIQVLSND